MATFAQRVRQATAFIQAARDEETPDGNPLLAARHYVTAMEIIATVSDEVPIADAKARSFFLYQLRQRMEVYYERAELLLGVAEETGLIDKPSMKGGLDAALQSLAANAAVHSTPPPLYGTGSGSGGGAGDPYSAALQTSSSNAVMGIPIEDSGCHSDGPSPQYYFSQPPQLVPTVPPPVTEPQESLDSLFGDLTFCDVKK